MTSVIIPSRNEVYLENTIRDLLAKATGEIEIIAILDGYWPHQVEGPYVKKPLELVQDPRVHYLHFGKARGMRGAINAGVELAKGEHILKTDGHCMFDDGFDEKLVADCEKDWIVVPRRYRLDGENWQINQDRKDFIDYMYICFPDDPNDHGGMSLKGREWREKNRDKSLEGEKIVDLMTAQGSCWFMHRDYFYELELLDVENYGHFSNEFQEIGFKCWLSGGRVIRNKKTWYAHLHKGKKYGRGWPLRKSVLDKGATYTMKWMRNEAWKKQTKSFEWIIKKFNPPGWENYFNVSFFRKGGGSGIIRGAQMATKLKARLNPPKDFEDGTCIYVKMQPPEGFPKKSYLDILDASERMSWLSKHPEIGVIASSKSGYKYLKEKLDRDDIILIPQHHCNFERKVREREEFNIAGVVGGQGAIKCDVEELKRRLGEMGIKFVWLRDYRDRKEVVEFYRNIDFQIIWRALDRPLKNPLKIINACSVGVPTIAYPEVGYGEMDGFYTPIKTIDELISSVKMLQGGFDSRRLIAKAEEYHIDKIAELYKQL